MAVITGFGGVNLSSPEHRGQLNLLTVKLGDIRCSKYDSVTATIQFIQTTDVSNNTVCQVLVKGTSAEGFPSDIPPKYARLQMHLYISTN
ncbi:predicted protein [Sclerotinia sclerotiorum 1980 UF-70]|uniref:Uncharacterized protein n=1 Tax=Sclerotinia sclerotiorum (strain ATCC 18683 / 1980 / Ss-1) TaxID=665079 RepID=A7ENJ0_SCLS1|nr:predicted protein [Sclerotinia sclerotiorum 1980 UF-70]EDO04406.1 predicted protein [Sclerotinia sclerotiorum 1980 UF-70]